MLTVAAGPRRYIDMAVSLARSLRLHSPDMPLAVATDSDDHRLHSLYDELIPLEMLGRQGLHHKLRLDRYSPFAETLFIDSDCLVVRPVEAIFELFAGKDFGVVGHAIRDGQWFMDVADVLTRIGRPELPKFNGGVYYFRRTSGAREVFDTARELAERYGELGLRRFRGTINEEPVYAISLATHGISPVEDGGRAMATPISVRGWLHVDTLGGHASWSKGGTRVRPAIVHFAGPYAAARDPRSAFYRRECHKLERADGRRGAKLSAGVLYAPLCVTGFLAINAYELAVAAAARVRALQHRRS